MLIDISNTGIKTWLHNRYWMLVALKGIRYNEFTKLSGNCSNANQHCKDKWVYKKSIRSNTRFYRCCIYPFGSRNQVNPSVYVQGIDRKITWCLYAIKIPVFALSSVINLFCHRGWWVLCPFENYCS